MYIILNVARLVPSRTGGRQAPRVARSQKRRRIYVPRPHFPPLFYYRSRRVQRDARAIKLDAIARDPTWRISLDLARDRLPSIDDRRSTPRDRSIAASRSIARGARSIARRLPRYARSRAARRRAARGRERASRATRARATESRVRRRARRAAASARDRARGGRRSIARREKRITTRRSGRRSGRVSTSRGRRRARARERGVEG